MMIKMSTSVTLMMRMTMMTTLMRVLWNMKLMVVAFDHDDGVDGNVGGDAVMLMMLWMMMMTMTV